jgi:DNA-binding transcriptional regulator GbsR (MarR family)
MDKISEKEELIELFGVHFEQLYLTPPLAARILAVLILDGCKSGLTFEFLLERMQASKSSISTNLNLLLKMGHVYYYTQSGDRKKYFKAAPLSKRLKNYLSLIDNEKILIEKIIRYRSQNNTCVLESINLQNSIAYQEHLLKIEEVMKNTIQKFKEIEKNNLENNSLS